MCFMACVMKIFVNTYKKVFLLAPSLTNAGVVVLSSPKIRLMKICLSEKPSILMYILIIFVDLRCTTSTRKHLGNNLDLFNSSSMCVGTLVKNNISGIISFPFNKLTQFLRSCLFLNCSNLLLVSTLSPSFHVFLE